VSGPDDRWFERYSDGEFDADVDMLLDGVVVDPRLVPLARLLDDARVVACGPPPAPTLELAAALTGHNVAAEDDLSPGAASAARIGRRYVPLASRAPSGHRSPARLPSRIGAMSWAAKAALSLAVAGAGAVGAGATGVLPESAVNAVRRAIEAVTPFDPPDAGASGHTDQGHHAAPTSGTTDREPVDRALAGPDAVAIEHRPPIDANLADDPRAATRRTSDDRSVAATSTNAPSSREPGVEDEQGLGGPSPVGNHAGAANGNAGGPSPQPPGSGHPAGGSPPGAGGPASSGGAGSPGPAGSLPAGHGRPAGGPPHDSGPPAGAGPPADAGAAAGPPSDGGSPSHAATPRVASHQQSPPLPHQPNRSTGPPAAGPPGGGPAGGAPAAAHDGAAPAAQPSATGPPPAPGL
jgi:collagen type III alpha